MIYTDILRTIYKNILQINRKFSSLM